MVRPRTCVDDSAFSFEESSALRFVVVIAATCVAVRPATWVVSIAARISVERLRIWVVDMDDSCVVVRA